MISCYFPDAFDVEDPFSALQVELRDLKNWELAPTNPAVLARASVPFALTAAGLKDKSKFLEMLSAKFHILNATPTVEMVH